MKKNNLSENKKKVVKAAIFFGIMYVGFCLLKGFPMAIIDIIIFIAVCLIVEFIINLLGKLKAKKEHEPNFN